MLVCILIALVGVAIQLSDIAYNIRAASNKQQDTMYELQRTLITCSDALKRQD